MRTEESKTASTILYSLLIFLTFIKAEARNYKQVCSSSSCGEINNISYPFRLRGDPSGCGDPDYELSCVNNKTILEIFPGKYYVKNISYEDQILRLVDVNFANANRSCSLPSGSVETTDGFVKDFRFRGVVASLGSRFRFVKCSRNISSLQDAANHTTVAYLLHDINYKFPSYEAVMELLEAGFVVGWSLECRDCSLAGKSCVVKSWDKPLTYICEREYKLTRTQGNLIIAGIVVGGLIALLVIIAILVFFVRKYRTRRNASSSTEKN
ncbi:uncharacterized protein Pyn_30628 [Prunus yedoensis var. nudiflora]|uniref:Wall-associated receptor kinase galacturonan-binding domain-containing protein n=1 Tax=Prunus yedoensis var. nudiflora TaxID=2094558 RepID=A0A314UD52_PRUYE|nr:uncharacterized protein Pyn_30628 [Prunus yedoensis var. nudiflora]